MTTPHPSRHHSATPPDLRALESALDALAASERAAAPAGFEQRVALASLGALRSEPALRLTEPLDAPDPARQLVQRRALTHATRAILWRARLAAAVALTAGAALLAVLGPSVWPSGGAGTTLTAAPTAQTHDDSVGLALSLWASLDELVPSSDLDALGDDLFADSTDTAWIGLDLDHSPDGAGAL
ncbi:MAG: hypothetical protein C0513_07475 [Isosphaera sp.]|nr:hypothetical protein [Isosphaera sp.]